MKSILIQIKYLASITTFSEEMSLIDELKPSSDLSNRLPVTNNVLKLTNVVKKPTCFRLQDA